MGRPKRSAAKQSSEKVKMLMVEDNREASGAVCSIPSTSDSEFSDASSISDSDSDMSDKVIEINSDSDPESRNKRKESPVSKENRLSSTLKEKGKRKSSLTDRQGGKQPKTATCSSGAGAKKKGKGLWGKDNVKLGDLDWEVWENELQSWGPWGNDSEIDIESLTRKKNPLDVKEPPPELLVPLLPFQMEWLGWSLKQEESNIRGGILADEMGMGKTIQAISLILASRALCHPNAIPNLPEEGRLSNALSTSTVGSSNLAWLHRSSSNLPLENSPGLGELPQVKATLVVCPLVAVIQWRNEIIRFTKEGSVKVLIYHGTKRCKNISELADYDIVLTTYAIAELEHRVSVMPAKEPCVWCGRLFYPDRMAVHLRFYCGPTAQRTEKQAKQVKKRGPRTFKRMLGKEMEGIGKDLYPSKVNKKNPEVAGKESEVIKDIQQLMSAVDGAEPKKKRGRKKKVQQEELEAALQEATDSLAGDPVGDNQCVGTDRGISLLHAVKWNRVILDEAHSIKDRRCSTAKAIFALRSKYKWALSGTPLQNRVGELYSLVRFLEIEPFSYYYCRICNCKSLDYSFGKEWRKCDHCQHSPLHHFCWWNKFIANPIKKWGYVNEGRKAMILLKYKLLDSTLLRRTKIERAADLALPPRTTFLRRDAFDTREDDFYQALYTQSQSQFNTYIAAGTLLNNYAHIFDLLTRLRQAVDHPYLVVYSTSSLSVANKSFNPSPLEGACGICNDPAEEAVATACNHVFCKACIQDYVLAAGETSGGQARPCPTCQKPLTVDLTGSRQVSGQDGIAKVKGYKRSSILNRINLDEFQTSSKIDALREEVMFMLEKDPAAKAIVFSQFTSFLDLIGFCLQKSGIKCVKLDGSMSMAARDQMIESFTNDPDIKVFLMSLKAGGVALNLTVASHVFLMDPWWNPAVEQQAQDRIHRIGQYKPIRVVRFVIENTIEERILRLQEKKQLVFEGTVGGSAEALGRLTEDDLRFLFTS